MQGQRHRRFVHEQADRQWRRGDGDGHHREQQRGPHEVVGPQDCARRTPPPCPRADQPAKHAAENVEVVADVGHLDRQHALDVPAVQHQLEGYAEHLKADERGHGHVLDQPRADGRERRGDDDR